VIGDRTQGADPDFGLGGRLSAECARIEAPQAPTTVGYGEGMSSSPLEGPAIIKVSVFI